MTDPYPTGPVVYILRNGKSLYVGATIDLSHRIRQHNGELSGGAHRTSTKGPGWVCLLYVQGFQSRTESLQFEYALKREAKHHGYSTQARKRAVHALLSQEHWTSRPLEAVTVDHAELQGRPSFWPRGGFPRSVHFVNPPPTEAVGRRPHRGRWGAAHKGGGWGSPTEGADFFARWVRQACGSAPLGGWGLSGAIWRFQRNPEAG